MNITGKYYRKKEHFKNLQSEERGLTAFLEKVLSKGREAERVGRECEIESEGSDSF